MDPKLVDIANRLVELKKFSSLMGASVSESRNALLRGLDPIEMSIVAALVNRQLYTSRKEEANVNQQAR